MVSFGYFLSCEEFGPRELVRQAERAADAGTRLEMIEEAVDVIRLLHQGGSHSHRGKHYTVENARPDPEPYVQQVQSFVDVGFDEVYVAQIGPRQEEFFRFWQDKVAPQSG